MYQAKLRKLNMRRPAARRAPTTTPKEEQPKPQQRLRSGTRTSTFPNLRRRARNVALVRALLGDQTGAPPLVLADSGARYEVCAPDGTDLGALFLDPLPIVTACDIPNGTRAIGPPKDDRMYEHTELVDAIDAGSTQIGRLSPQVAYFLRNSRAPSTRRLYQWAWKRVLRTCSIMDRAPLPMSEATAAMVLVDAVNDGLVFGSIRILASVISVAHGIAKAPDPTQTESFRSVIRGIGRMLSHRPDQKVALMPQELRLIHDACVADQKRVRGTRDWAIVAFGFAGAFRRSEIVSRNTDDLEFFEDELRVYLDRSKTDQYGRGTYVSIRVAKDPEVCPVAAVRAWLAMLPGPGPLFRRLSKHQTISPRRLSAHSVCYIVKCFGVVLELPEDYLGAHSLRAGMITALLDAGVSNAVTRDLSRPEIRRYAAALLSTATPDAQLYRDGGAVMGAPRPSRAGSLPVAQLPNEARAFAELPYADFTEASRLYHLRTYERWCARHEIAPWPPTLTVLLEFAAERAQTCAYYTVRAHVRIVSMEERKRSGVDYYAYPELQRALDGIRRRRPPRPVPPLRPAQVEQLFAYRPTTAAQRRARAMLLLSYAAGFSLLEHVRLRCEMVEFAEDGVTIRELGADRPRIFIGKGQDLERCPVRALRELVGARTAGFIYSPRSRSHDRHYHYDGAHHLIATYGRAAGIAPLSNDRVRLAGLVEQARHIDIVRLAHFHGYRTPATLATLLGRYVEIGAGAKWAFRKR